MTMTETAAEPAPRWFWILTLNYADDHESMAVGTSSGHMDLRPGSSRSKALGSAIRYTMQVLGLPEDKRVAVVFFSLEPDRIGTTA